MITNESVELLQSVIQREICSLFDRYGAPVVFDQMAAVATQVAEASPGWNDIWDEIAFELETISDLTRYNAALCQTPRHETAPDYRALVCKLNSHPYGVWSKQKPNLELKILPPGRD